MTTSDLTYHYRTCTLCEAMCGLEITVQDQRIHAIRGDKDDPFSQGHICPKATALQDVYEDPDRLRYPVRRTATGWEQISWTEAFDAVEAGLKSVQEAHGTDAVGAYLGNPNAHNWGSLLFAPQFLHSLHTKHRFSASSVDQLPSHFAARLMFGHYFLIPVPDIDHTDFLLMLGANPAISNGSLMSAAGMKRRLKAIQQRGGQVVVIDPRRTETAVSANSHLFIKPGTDALFLLALIHTILSEGLDEPGRLQTFTDGFEEITHAVTPFTPESVAAATGIDADITRQLARDFCAAKTAVCYGRLGVSTHAFGGLCQWAIHVLNILSGNLDRRGGSMFTTPAFDVVGISTMMGRVGKLGRWHSRVRGLPEFNGELPAAVMAEEILTPGDGQIRAMVTIAGNPVLSTPNGRQLDDALATLDFMVAIDIYINETTRHADIILPPTTGLETDHYDIAFHLLAVRNSAKYSPPLFEPAADRMHDWQILRELQQRMASKRQTAVHRKIARLNVFNRYNPQQILDLGLRMGPHGAWNKRQPHSKAALTLRKLKAAPHGIDLGALQPMLKARVCTENGRVQLAPAPILADLPRLSAFLQENGAETPFPLSLIGRRHLRSNNSWMHNSRRLVRGKNRCTLLMHPDDAAARQLEAGQMVQLSSRVGAVRLPVAISDEMMAGVVSLPHGWGHNRDGVRLHVAVQHKGVSLNDVTDDQLLDALTGNAAFSGVPVQVCAAPTG